MASVVDISNRALQKLGASRIISLTDDSVSARACNLAYEPVRDRELRKHAWNFAITRIALASDATAPAFGYTNAFTLPSDCLRVLPNDRNEGAYENAFKIEGRKILANNEGPIYIRYIARITDTTMFDAIFTEAISSAMAVEMCEELTQSNSKREIANADYSDAIKQARRQNAFEMIPTESETDTWITARL